MSFDLRLLWGIVAKILLSGFSWNYEPWNKMKIAMLDPIFKGRQYPPDIILWAVRWYCKYPLAYRMVEEMLKERGVDVAACIYKRPCLQTRGISARNKCNWRGYGARIICNCAWKQRDVLAIIQVVPELIANKGKWSGARDSHWGRPYRYGKPETVFASL